MTSTVERLLSRRRFLKGSAGVAFALPWLELLDARTAHAAAAPTQRFGVMFSPNGTVASNWVPAGTESAFTLSPILAPLTEHQSDLVIIEGVDQQGGGGDGHQNGMSGMLTGAPLLAGSFAGVGAPPAGWASGPSVDQRIADALGRSTPYRSLELGVQVGAADNWGRMVYRAAGRPLPPRDDPRRVFEDLFGAARMDPAERERLQARRASVLDFVKEQLGQVSSKAGADDKQRLDRHLTYVRDVEQRLQQQGATLDACQLPPAPTLSPDGNDAFPTVGALQIDLLVLALGCGLTRVASLQWSRSVSQTRFTWLGIDETHHDLSHLPDADAVAQDKLTRINTWYAEQFASLIAGLKGYSEGDRTLFDQCLLLWCNELGTGNTHSRKDAPYVLAGSAGGALTTGRYLRSGDVPHNNLLESVMHLLNVPDQTFGKAEWCTGPLTGLA